MPLPSRFLLSLLMANQQNVSLYRARRVLVALFQSACLLAVFISDIGFCQDNAPSGPPTQSLRIQKLDLLNGLRTLVVEQKDFPVVSVNLLIRGGSMYDPPSGGGTAFLLAHALFYSNQRKTNSQWKDELEELGIDFKIRVDPECVVFQGNVPAQNLEPFLNTLSTMVLYPSFRKENLEMARRQLLEGSLLHPQLLDLADSQFRSTTFGNHPYGKPILGDPDSLNRIQPEDLDRFYRSYYLPNNSALICVGDVLASQIANSTREKWGRWTKGNRPSLPFFKLTTQDRFSIRLLPVKKGNDIAMVYGHLGPSRLTSDFYTLHVLMALLAGRGADSHLAREFRRVGVSCQSLEGDFIFYQDAGLFRLVIQTTSQEAAGILQSIVSTIDALKQKQVTEDELEAARRSLVRSFREDLGVPGKVADNITAVELYDLASDYLLTYATRIEEVTPERVQEAARTYLDTSHAVAVVAGGSEELADELQKKVGPVEILGLARKGE